MQLFRQKPFDRLQKLVDNTLMACWMRWGMQAKELRIDHNLMIEAFGSPNDTALAGLPVRAIPLEYGRDYILLVVPLQGVPVGVLPDGTVERIA